MNESPAYDPRYLRGVAFFNDCDFFEAHEVWEDLWADHTDATRRFYQGMIQLAVCLHHFGNGNTRGAKKLYYSCRGYLDEYQPHHLGIDVVALLQQLERCCAKLLDSPDDFPRIEIDPDLIPEIKLDPAG
jgi:predicted metal-dependent hydrolase